MSNKSLKKLLAGVNKSNIHQEEDFGESKGLRKVTSNKTLGAYGESLAHRYLQKQGYRILEENFRNKLGEIDLIVQDGKTVCFVEVKTRRSLDQGQPYEAVTPWKIRKLSQMAAIYLKYKFHSLEVPSRFDVISIIQDKAGTPIIQHIKNAFDSVC